MTFELSRVGRLISSKNDHFVDSSVIVALEVNATCVAIVARLVDREPATRSTGITAPAV